MPAQAQTLVAGTTAGQFSVSESGAATYRIPIQVPPGVAGMEPKLELAYSSQGGNGAMGLGWGLSGLSAITRCPRTMASDGVRGAVNLDANDRYCLDGQRLLMTMGTVYGAASTEYRTEIESFSKITFDGAAFTVKTKAGLTIEYGVTGDARIEAQGKTMVRTWAANKITDKVGNYLTISYDEDVANGAYYVSRIDYAGPAGQTANRSVRFENLTGRLDGVPMYQNGSLIKTVKRLNTVKTYIGENLVKEYRLTYAPQTTAFDRSRLTSFTECDGLNNCLKPIQFTWTPSLNGLLTLKSNLNITDTNLAHSNKTAGSWLGDFNGDGKTDTLRWSDTVANNELYLSNGDGTFTKSLTFNIKDTYLGNSTGTAGALLGDFNGDGKTDILRWQDAVANNELYLSNGDGTFTKSLTFNIKDTGLGISTNTLGSLLADFDGDGKTDILRWRDTFANNELYLSNGDGTFTKSLTFNIKDTYLGYSAGTTGSMLGDFNGDGKTDILRWQDTFANNELYLSNGDGTFTKSTTFNIKDTYIAHSNRTVGSLLGDFNGDGKTDVLRWWDTYASNELYLSNGDGTFTKSLTFNIKDTYIAHSNRTVGSLLGDFDGDGKTDILRWWDTVVNNEMYLSHGDGTFTKAAGFTIKGTGLGISTNTLGSLPGDFNGDGKTDLLRWSDTVTSNVLYSSNELINSDTVEKITSDREVSFSYTPLTASSVYTKDSSATYPLVDLQPAMFVTSMVRTSNAIGTGLNVSNYTYGGLKAEAGSGRGALGFRWIKNKEQSTNIESYSEYRQDWPYVGMLVKNETRLAGAGNGGILQRTTLVPACKVPQTGEFCTLVVGNRYFPYATSRLEQSWDLNTTAYPSLLTNTVYNLNAPDTELRGDPTQIYVNAIQDGFISTRTTVNEYLPADVSSWKLGRLTKSTVTSSDPVALPGGFSGEVAVLGLTVTPLSSVVQLNGPGTASTSVVATASGGVGPYVFNWTRITGSRTVISNGNTANPTFAVTLAVGEDFTEILRGTLTDAVGGKTYADVSVQYSAGFSFKKTISVNTLNYNLRAEAAAGGWDQVMPLLATVTINPGVIVSSPSTSTYAFDTGVNFPANSTLKLVNDGLILGMGGAGGNSLAAGNPGGPALKAQYPLSVTNNGTVAGGGGGGGAGAFWSWNGYNRSTAGSGGASGLVAAPGGLKLADQAPAPNGNPSYDSNYNGDMDTLGASANWGWGGRLSSPGGKGGAWGGAGDAGGNVDGAYNFTGYAGGTAGAAAQGNNYINWLTAGTRLGALEVAVPLSLTVTPASAYVQINGGGAGSTSVTAVGSAGVTPYTYNWTRIVGTRTVITNGSTTTPTFSATLTTGENVTETMRVTLTDAVGATTFRDVNVQYLAPAAPYVFNQTISSNASNYDLRAAAVAAGWNGVAPLQANVTVNSGVIVSASSVASYGFDTGASFPAGSILAVVNNGSILGMGGAGGAGGSGPGGVGGAAFRAQYAISVTNNGTIGGGGSGGAGGANAAGYCGRGENPCTMPGGGGGGGRSGLVNSAGGAGWIAGGVGTLSAPGSGGPGRSGNGGTGGTGSTGGQYGGGPAVVGNTNIVWQVTGTRLGGLN